MDDSNYANVLRVMPNSSTAQVFRFVEFLPEEKECKNVEEIPDPYYGDLSDFEHVYQLLNKGMPKLLSKIQSKSN
jgi:protein-tyrosine phosphatase